MSQNFNRTAVCCQVRSQAQPTADTISKTLKMHKATVKKYLRQLVDKGCIIERYGFYYPVMESWTRGRRCHA